MLTGPPQVVKPGEMIADAHLIKQATEGAQGDAEALRAADAAELAGVSLLDPVDGHVLATMQPLPDAPPYLSAPFPGAADIPVVPGTGGEWVTTTPDGYVEVSANVAAFIRWSVDGVMYPTAAYWDVYYRPDLVRQALKFPGE